MLIMWGKKSLAGAKWTVILLSRTRSTESCYGLLKSCFEQRGQVEADPIQSWGTLAQKLNEWAEAEGKPVLSSSCDNKFTVLMRIPLSNRYQNTDKL
jgi:hypothetical protein